MGELIFVLVIVVQGIAGIAAAINKKKRDREKKEAEASALTPGGAKQGQARDASEVPAEGFAARLKKATSADTRSGPTITAFSQDDPKDVTGVASTTPSVSTSDGAKPGQAASAQASAIDDRLARRRAQIAQLRALATKSIASTTASPPAPPAPAVPGPSQRTSAAAPPPVRRAASASRQASAPARSASRGASASPATTVREARTARQSRAAQPDAAKPASLLGGSTKRASKARKARQGQELRRLLSRPSEVQRAIILKELLDPPVALRPDYDRAL